MIKLERGQEMGRQHMLQFRLNDKQWEEIMQIRKEHCFDNNGQLYKFLFFNAMLGVQREKELEKLSDIEQEKKIEEMEASIPRADNPL